MSRCSACGANDQYTGFCTNCGSPIAANGQAAEQVGAPSPFGEGSGMRQGPVQQPEPEPTGYIPVPFWPTEGGQPGSVQGGWANVPPPPLVPPPLVPPPSPPPTRSRRNGILVAAIAVAVVLIAGTTYFVLSRPSSSTGGLPAPGPQISSAISTSSSAPATSAVTTSPGQNQNQTQPVIPSTVVVTTVVTTSASVPSSTAPASTPPASTPSKASPTSRPTTPRTVAPPVNPMGGEQVAFTCNSGYYVQVASEVTQPAFVARVSVLRAHNALPAGSKWTTTGAGCPLYGHSNDDWVLYAGPFPTAYAACAARLASPADALIRSTNPSNPREFESCLCPANTSTLPVEQLGNPADVWTGELQYVLRSPKFKYQINDIDGGPTVPAAWGTFTGDTLAAVEKFQSSQGLDPTGVVDATTWSYLQSAACIN